MNNTFELLIPHFKAAQDGDWINLGDHRGRPLVSSSHTGGSFLLAEVEADFNGGVPPHIHTLEDETFHVQEGIFSLMIGDQTITAGPGDTAFAPRDIVHTWRCVSEEGGKMLLLVTPGESFERFVYQMGQQGVVPSDPASIEAICALSQAHGMTMLPPEV